MGAQPTAHVAFRKTAGNPHEQGSCYTFSEEQRMGLLKITREYNLYYWPESAQWEGDVIDHEGWHDLTEDECMDLACKLWPMGCPE